MNIAEFDPELAAAIKNEERRQEEHLELIASENYTSPRVLEAQGSLLTNKYAEGYPGKRYYGGCEFVDVAEELAIERAQTLFDADFANVQPHSGSQANAAAYLALAEPGAKLLGMSLAEGGHLTHGASVNFSVKLFQSVQYGLDANSGEIDYDQVRRLAKKHLPKIIVGGFSAYSRIVDWAQFRRIADEVDAYFVADMAHVAGLVATGHYPSPVPHAHVTTTTTHKTLRGPRGGLILCGDNPDIQKRLKSLVFPGTQGGPLMHTIAAKAVALKEAMSQEFVTYQAQVLDNAKTLANDLQRRGQNLVSGGTDNHLMLLDFSNRLFSGKDAEIALGRANITVNKNAIPGDKRSPFVTSGIRVGTPALTTRGFGPNEMLEVSRLISLALENIERMDALVGLREEVRGLARRCPVYAG